MTKGETPIDGLDTTLKAEVIYGDRKRDLPLDGSAGRSRAAYESVFIPTVGRQVHLPSLRDDRGQRRRRVLHVEPDGFNEVQEATSGQFPVTLPTAAELSAEASKGSDAASQVTIALVLGGGRPVVGLLALGVALASRRRRPAA